MTTKDLDREYLIRQAEMEINRILSIADATDRRLRLKGQSDTVVYLTNDYSKPGCIVVHAGGREIKGVKPAEIDNYVDLI